MAAHSKKRVKKVSKRKSRSLSQLSSYIILGILIFVCILIFSIAKQFFPVFPAAHTTSWCDLCLASSLRIPAIGFDDQVSQVSFDQRQNTWPTPVTGIATPDRHIANNIIIFGHSKWFNQTYSFAKIADLKPNDQLLIRDQYGREYDFAITDMMIVDRRNSDMIAPKTSLQLTLLTSVRANGQWLLSHELSPTIIDQTSSNQIDASLVIVAKPQF